MQLPFKRVGGVAVALIGLVVLFSPFLIGEWIMALLGILLIIAGLIQFVSVVKRSGTSAGSTEYISGGVAVLFGGLLFLSPSIVLSGTLIAASVFLAADGAARLWSIRHLEGSKRWWAGANGLFYFLLAAGVWLIPADLGLVAIGIILGLKLMVEGWSLALAPETGEKKDAASLPAECHPYSGLGLSPNPSFRRLNEEFLRTDAVISWENIYWSGTVLAILFAIHVVRTDASWSFVDLISPFTAVVGDAIVALLVGLIVVLPARLLWRRATRPVERAAWNHLLDDDVVADGLSLFERGLKFWMVSRMRFAHELVSMRFSLNYSFWRLMRFGLPTTAVLVAVNSIWGFSWYFNSENWASAVYQEITKGRVDVWRERMATDVENAALATGIPKEKIFAIDPEGVKDDQDFSFIVIGDTGEGDPSQMVLRDRIIEAGARPEVKFLVLSSDVIYPDGKMRDYERNFYLPFKGFNKPIYAIPGNHDWFDANDGFNANFLDPDSARRALRGRYLQDRGAEAFVPDDMIDRLISESARLREYYGIRNGLQRAPFFEMHASGFSLIAADTGILRRLDKKQMDWFTAALDRAGTNFKLVVLGHPFYVAGKETYSGDAEFSEVYELIKRKGVDVVMAGDTHDFELYKIRDLRGQSSGRETLHFVNGGGGAYLSIGTAVGFPEVPVTPHWGFYPRTDAVTEKIRREAPLWKFPFLIWLEQLGGWPLDQETVSGAFDFNSAPFFQSFLEVRVERSEQRVRFILHGAQGVLRWRDIQAAPGVIPEGKMPDDPVEFIAPINGLTQNAGR